MTDEHPNLETAYFARIMDLERENTHLRDFKEKVRTISADIPRTYDQLNAVLREIRELAG